MPKLENFSLENGHHRKYYQWSWLVVTTQQGEAKAKKTQALEDRQSSLFTPSPLCPLDKEDKVIGHLEKNLLKKCLAFLYIIGVPQS